MLSVRPGVMATSLRRAGRRLRSNLFSVPFQRRPMLARWRRRRRRRPARSTQHPDLPAVSGDREQREAERRRASRPATRSGSRRRRRPRGPPRAAATTGMRTRRPPAAVATPLPPRKRVKQENECPTRAARGPRSPGGRRRAPPPAPAGRRSRYHADEEQREPGRDGALQGVEGEHEVARALAEHPADVGGPGALAADLEDVDAVRARDQVAERERAEQVAGRRRQRERPEQVIEFRGSGHGALQLHELREPDGPVALQLARARRRSARCPG